MTKEPLDEIVRDISILYEISLSIGSSLDLKENCDSFLKTLMARKGLTFTSVWIRSDYAREGGSEDGASLVYANPETYILDTELPLTHPLFTLPARDRCASFAHGMEHFNSLVNEQGIEQGAYAVFSLPNIGVVKLYDVTRDGPFTRKELNMMAGIMTKFSRSVEACLVYKRMRREITERRKTEKELANSRRRYENIFQAASVSIWEEDISGIKKAINELKAAGISDFRTYLEENPAFVKQAAGMLKVLDVNDITLKLYGAKDKRELLGSLHKVFTPESYAVFKEILLAVAEGKTFFEAESVNKNLQGDLLNVLMTVSIPAETAASGLVLVSIMDITARKKAEEARHMLVFLIENSSDFIGMALLDGRMLYLNTAGQGLVGLEGNEEVMRTAMYDFFSEEDRRLFETKLLPLGSWKTEIRLRHFKTGKLIPVDMQTFIIKEPETDKPLAIATISRDITLRKNMEEELLTREKLESLGVLAGGIAHDFNNLLTGVLGNISMAKAKTDPQDKIYGLLEESEKASLRARDLTQQLLTFSKGGQPVKRVIAVERLVRDAAGFALRGSRVKPAFSFSPDLPLINADEGQISQVVHNLVINADQAMPAGGTLEVRCDAVLIERKDALPLEPGRYVRIAVKDSGTGISQEYLPKIFDPYFTTKQKGSGLGLATVYSIVKRHGGHVTVESRLASGTAFSVYLPAAEQARPEPPKKEELIRSGSGRILIMDDEEMVRTVVRKMLETLGYHVEDVDDGRAAITRYQEALASGNPFDLVIMDLTIPGGMGGREALEKLRAIDPRIKAIVSSGYSNDPVMAEFRDYGFSGVVAKPYKIQDLARIVRDVISK